MDLKIQLPKELEELYGKPRYLEVDEDRYDFSVPLEKMDQETLEAFIKWNHNMIVGLETILLFPDATDETLKFATPLIEECKEDIQEAKKFLKAM